MPGWYGVAGNLRLKNIIHGHVDTMHATDESLAELGTKLSIYCEKPKPNVMDSVGDSNARLLALCIAVQQQQYPLPTPHLRGNGVGSGQ